MARRIFAGANLFAGPHDLDRRVEQPPKLLEIERRAVAEDDVEDRIVRVVGGTANDPAGVAVLGGKMDDRRLPLGKVSNVAAHIVEQDGEIMRPEQVELGELASKRGLPSASECRCSSNGLSPMPKRTPSACKIWQMPRVPRIRPADSVPASDGASRDRPWAHRDRSDSRGGRAPRRRLAGRPNAMTVRRILRSARAAASSAVRAHRVTARRLSSAPMPAPHAPRSPSRPTPRRFACLRCRAARRRTT